MVARRREIGLYAALMDAIYAPCRASETDEGQGETPREQDIQRWRDTLRRHRRLAPATIVHRQGCDPTPSGRMDGRGMPMQHCCPPARFHPMRRLPGEWCRGTKRVRKLLPDLTAPCFFATCSCPVQSRRSFRRIDSPFPAVPLFPSIPS